MILLIISINDLHTVTVTPLNHIIKLLDINSPFILHILLNPLSDKGLKSRSLLKTAN